MHAFDVLGDPVRRRILELLADGEASAGDIAAVVGAEFGISQPAVSQHLKVLRESGFATVRPAGTRRLYAVDAAPLQEIDDWLEHFRRFWGQRLDSLAQWRRALHGEPEGAEGPNIPADRHRDPRLRLSDEELTHRLIFLMVNEAARCVEEKVVDSPEDADYGMILGTGFAPFRGGPIHYAKDRGVDEIVATLKTLESKFGKRFTPDPGWDKIKRA